MAKSRPPLEEMTLRQLRKVASSYNISRYSRMRKSQLLEAILNIEGQNQHSPASSWESETQELMEASKFELGTNNSSSNVEEEQNLASVDEELPELPGGYGKSRIVMMPRDPQWSYVYWDISNEHKEELRHQGGQQLVLRLYDVTEAEAESNTLSTVQEFPVDELAREWYVPIPISDRDYLCEIGYRCADSTWLVLATSKPVHMPPVYPSDWIEDHFIELDWENNLEEIPEEELTLPEPKNAQDKSRHLEDRNRQIYEEIFEISEPLEGQRLTGSFYNSMPPSSVSSYIFASGVGFEQSFQGEGETPRQFLEDISPQFTLVGEKRLMLSGATYPEATVILGEQQIQSNAEGKFYFLIPFTENVMECPITVYSKEGHHIFSLQMKLTKHPTTVDTEVTAETVSQVIRN